MNFYYPRSQFALFRIVFGLYLLIHFLYLIPVASELWSSGGLLSDISLNLSYGAFPSILYIFDSPFSVTLFVSVMGLFSFFVMIGFYRRVSSLLLWYGWAVLFHQNNLILNPGIPMVGWLLLALAIIPPGEGWGIEKRREDWYMPQILFWGAWIIVGIAYTISGVDKAQAPSWIDGSAITHLLHNPLARDYFLREWLLSTPELVRQLLTWGVLFLEIVFGLLVVFGRTRIAAWFMIVAMHLGILMVVDFPDLTFGVLMIHLFTFDARWFQQEHRERIIFFDGICGLCNRSVDILIRLDEQKRFKYASLQGSTAGGHGIEKSLDSVVFYENGNYYEKSTAILKILNALGGVWVFTRILYIFPKVLRDGIYDIIARYRYDMFGKREECRVPRGQEKEIFLG